MFFVIGEKEKKHPSNSHFNFEGSSLAPVHRITAPLMQALEPRILYDAAGLIAGLDLLPEHDPIDPNPGQEGENSDIDSSSDLFADVFISAESEQSGIDSIVFVDPGVTNYGNLINNDTADTRIVVLNPETDGITQIRDVLSQYKDIQTVHIISHGNSGQITLGQSVLCEDSIDDYTTVLQEWSTSLAKGADILLYGCNVAEGVEGKAFVAQLSDITGADVAASCDITGAAGKGGDWELEIRVGEIESNLIVSDRAQDAYTGTLANITVTDGGDDQASGVDYSGGLITLREALWIANNNSQNDTIIFDASLSGSTITLNYGELEISSSQSVTINGDISGNGSYDVTLDGNTNDRLFNIDSIANLYGLNLINGETLLNGGAIYNAGTLTIENSTISGNKAGDDGGGIYNLGTLIVENSIISSNQAANHCGGIDNRGVSATIRNSTVTLNDSADGHGGGLLNYNSTLTIENTTISSNEAEYRGGGIFNYNATLIIDSCKISDNIANKSNGGGIHSQWIVDIKNSTISGNESGDDGGGISNRGTLTIENSSILNSIAGDDGGGIDHRFGSLTMESVAVSGNQAGDDGGGIYNKGTLTINNSTILSNYADDIAGGIDNRDTLSIWQSTISSNKAGDNSGGIYNLGSLTIENSTISSNQAVDHCGGIDNRGVSATIRNSTITLNDSADGNGGGLRNYNSTLTIENTTISSNEAEFRGGGIFNYNATLIIDSCKISDNIANKSNGGGIHSQWIVDIKNSTISGNESGDDGGGISNRGTLTIENSSIVNGIAGDDGGGIDHRSGSLTMESVVISGNQAGDDGGGVYNKGTLTINNSTILSNYANDIAGGIDNRDILSIGQSTVSSNKAGNHSGGIFNYNGTLIIEDSTISNNIANIRDGGGINSQWNATIKNSTIYNNTAGDNGGGIYNSGTLTLENSTISGNTAANRGGGIFNGNNLYLYHSTLSENTATIGPGIHNTATGNVFIGYTIISSEVTASAAGIISQGYNLFTQAIVDGSIGSDLLGADADLQPLADNSGPTLTHALGINSDAFGAGSMAAVAGSGGIPSYDGRGSGFSRVFGVIDIGAVEMGGAGLTVIEAGDNQDVASNDINAGNGYNLREALWLSNNAIGMDTISFNAALAGTTNTLNYGELTISSSDGATINGDIDGDGQFDVTLDGNNNYRIFNINSGATASLTALYLNNGMAAGQNGGGIYNDGTLTIQNSTIANSTADLYGGGIYNGETLIMQNSTIFGNSASKSGGGIHNNGTLSMEVSTISGNSAAGQGGGIYNRTDLVLYHGTFTANSGLAGSGIYSLAAGKTTIGHTIVTGGIIPEAGGIDSQGYNLFVQPTVNGAVASDLLGADADLQTLADNGGATLTHALGKNSDALDSGDSAAMAGFAGIPSYDQRGVGFSRVSGIIDRGAVENQVPTANDDGYSTDKDTPITTGNVLLNDIDPDITDTLSIDSFDTTGTKGIVTDNGDGTFKYNPNGQFGDLNEGESASDTFIYTVSDGNGGTDTATVTIVITGVYDPPSSGGAITGIYGSSQTGGNAAPVGTDDSFSTSENLAFTTGNVLINDTDPDTSDILRIQRVDTSGTTGNVTNNSDGTFAYDPNGQFDNLGVGETTIDTFVYTVSDGKGGTDTVIVTITITGVRKDTSGYIFNIPSTNASFADLITDIEKSSIVYEPKWYQIWTGNEAGTKGDFVDTSSFYTPGNGWIEAADLPNLIPDYCQFYDTAVWIRSWTESGGAGAWSYSLMPFQTIETVDIKETVSGICLIDEMFNDENIFSQHWYKIWVGQTANENTEGSYLDTSALNNDAGKGWVRASELADVSYIPCEPGSSQEFWVKAWSPATGGLGWKHWTVSYAQETEIAAVIENNSDLSAHNQKATLIENTGAFNNSVVQDVVWQAVAGLDADTDRHDQNRMNRADFETWDTGARQGITGFNEQLKMAAGRFERERLDFLDLISGCRIAMPT